MRPPSGFVARASLDSFTAGAAVAASTSSTVRPPSGFFVAHARGGVQYKFDCPE